jgi:hypothetical protein
MRHCLRLALDLANIHEYVSAPVVPIGYAFRAMAFGAMAFGAAPAAFQLDAAGDVELRAACRVAFVDEAFEEYVFFFTVKPFKKVCDFRAFLGSSSNSDFSYFLAIHLFALKHMLFQFVPISFPILD